MKMNKLFEGSVDEFIHKKEKKAISKAASKAAKAIVKKSKILKKSSRIVGKAVSKAVKAALNKVDTHKR
jgi:hypothetical protein